MKTITLKAGQVVFVDGDYYEEASKYSWSVDKWGYARRHTIRNKKALNIFMHREVIDAPKGMMVDHKNGNPLDNRKTNLRLCTQSENQRNRRGNLNSSSKYKGVSWNKASKKWQVSFSKKYVGLYENEDDAARAYNALAAANYGEFARLNQPKDALKKAGA